MPKTPDDYASRKTLTFFTVLLTFGVLARYVIEDRALDPLFYLTQIMLTFWFLGIAVIGRVVFKIALGAGRKELHQTLAKSAFSLFVFLNLWLQNSFGVLLYILTHQVIWPVLFLLSSILSTRWISKKFWPTKLNSVNRLDPATVVEDPHS